MSSPSSSFDHGRTRLTLGLRTSALPFGPSPPKGTAFLARPCTIGSFSLLYPASCGFFYHFAHDPDRGVGPLTTGGSMDSFSSLPDPSLPDPARIVLSWKTNASPPLSSAPLLGNDGVVDPPSRGSSVFLFLIGEDECFPSSESHQLHFPRSSSVVYRNGGPLFDRPFFLFFHRYRSEFRTSQ